MTKTTTSLDLNSLRRRLLPQSSLPRSEEQSIRKIDLLLVMTNEELAMLKRQCHQVTKNQPNTQLSYASVRAFMPKPSRYHATVRKFARGLMSLIDDELARRELKSKEDLFDKDQRSPPE